MGPSSSFRPALRLLHYWWPVAMGVSTVVVINRATGTPVDAPGLALLLCGILAGYSVDRIIDRPPVPTIWWLQPTLLVAVAVVGVAGAFLLTLMPLRTVALVTALGMLVLAYPRLKALPLLKTVIGLAGLGVIVALIEHRFGLSICGTAHRSSHRLNTLTAFR